VGSQQLLLIVVGTLVVGMMVIIGITLFVDHAAATNRDEISNDLIHAASIAQAYHRRPLIMGGGGGSFVGFDLRTVFRELQNMNGHYSVFGTPTDSTIVIEGLGTQPGYDNAQLVKVSIRVYPSRTEVNEVN
jgi:hypothetical protein